MNQPSNHRSLSTLYYDPEAEVVPDPEPEPTPEPKQRKRRAPSEPKAKPKPKRNIPWYRIVRTALWWAVAISSLLWLYLGVLGWLGQSAAYITIAVLTPAAALLLDRDGRKMREGPK